MRFEGLLYEFFLSAHREEIFSIKIEVDTKPPAGAVLETRVVRRYIPLHLQHHDRSSLFAGKIHSIMQRNYVKGRDFYDLVWYLSDPKWPEPNFEMLNNALIQTGWKGEVITCDNWHSVLLRAIESLELTELVRDVKPFLENSNEVNLLTRENIVQLIKKQ